ncbi:hypothetical protein [Sphingomonas paucimobilis]|uniref:hypothetical protein n=1 Tax=Sphingomonas paucimobilis TaxID=13689 RepID=UPI0028D55EC9|nr:hypothetical protein [Sphingomonas paucimobilis]
MNPIPIGRLSVDAATGGARGMAGYGRCLGLAVDEVAVRTIGLVAAAQDTSTATHGYSAVPHAQSGVARKGLRRLVMRVI